MRRRTFIKATGLGAVAVAAGVDEFKLRAATKPGAVLEPVTLPAGNAPAPVPLPHFPSRLHAFVWRNWQLVPAERLANVVGTTRKQIERVAQAMGLGAQPRITRDQQRRSYLTVIKRNWHLLPYEQLLALLGWSAEKLAYTLREDDFFFIKLGSHKPKCEPLQFVSADAAVRAREDALAKVIGEYFPRGTNPTEPLFAFVEELSSRRWSPKLPEGSNAMRLCYSYFALYGDPLLEPGLDPYPDGYLARLAEKGVNAVWLQGVLSKLAPFPWQPELSARHEERLKNLQRLTTRARKYGIAIYLYLNEPRAMPLPFFAAHPGLKGAVEGDHAALCTSNPEVQRWMRDSVQHICDAVPALGGFFTITASENFTNCWSHGAGAKCPRCGRRPGADVIAEVNRLISSGIESAARRASPKERLRVAPSLLAWDWGWNDAWAEPIVNQLPQDCALMSVSEWSLPIERGGVKTTVGEYSISAVGPGPRAKRHWELARQRGLRVIAKIQAGNSWELSSVPYIPALENVARHVSNLRDAGVADVMLGWTLGGYPSPNIEVACALLNDKTRSPDEVLPSVAQRRFGAGAATVVRAWREFSVAFREFPFHIGVSYSGPQQLGPANLLWEMPTGYHASMVGFPYDDLDGWRAVYPPPVFVEQFEKVADGFAKGIELLKRFDAGKLTSEQRHAIDGEIRIAEASEIHFRSVANQARFVMLRRALKSATNAAAAEPNLARLESVLRSEMELARQLHALQRADSRIGFEASNQYYYVPADLAEKVLNCRDLLERWLPAERKRWQTAGR